MRGAILNAAGDVRFEERPDPVIKEPTDAVIRVSATCVCGPDLWPYRGIDQLKAPRPYGHEHVGVVEEVGTAVTTLRPGKFVVGGFYASDGTCEHCRAGFPFNCDNQRRDPVMAISAAAQRDHEELFPGHESTLAVTPPELIECFDNLAFDEVL